MQPEISGTVHTERLAYKLAPLAVIDPLYQPPDFIFNTGNYVATSGCLKRSDFDEVIRGISPDVTVTDLRAGKTGPLLIHLAGSKPDNIREMPRADLLQFHQDYDDWLIQTIG